MRKYVRPKFKKPRKPKGFRSIPLRNPAVVNWNNAKGRPNPVGGPTEECFEDDANWYIVNNGRYVRMTGEPEPKLRYVRIKTSTAHMELRMYFVGTEYYFVLRNSRTKLETRSVSYRGRDAAVRAQEIGIRWLETKPFEGQIER